MPVAAVNGQQINYAETGEGSPIIWSHGFFMDLTMFDAQIDEFAAAHRCVAWDERGFGETPVDGPFTYWDSADDAVALLDHLSIDRAVFAGMSQGGFLGLRAALRYPDRVAALILIDSQAGLEDPANLEQYGGLIDYWLSDQPLEPVAEIVAELILGRDELNAEWMPIWAARRDRFRREVADCLLDRDDITDRLGEISCPTLVIHGDADAAIPLERAEALVDGIEGAQLTVIPGGTHAANLTNPAEVNAAIGVFLDSL